MDLGGCNGSSADPAQLAQFHVDAHAIPTALLSPTTYPGNASAPSLMFAQLEHEAGIQGVGIGVGHLSISADHPGTKTSSKAG